MLSFRLTWIMVMFWFVLALWTGVSNLSFAVMATDNIIETGLQPQDVNLDRPIVGGDPISTNVRVPSTSFEWTTFLADAARLDSSVWQGWMGFIRNFFLISSGLYMLYLIWDGIRTLTGFAGRP